MDFQRGKKLVEMALANQPQENKGNENQVAPLEHASIADDPILSTSSGHAINVISRPEFYFSIDDSVQDTDYEPPSIPRPSSSLGSEEDTVQPITSPKKSLRSIKREKKIKRNLGQAYKTLKGKVIPERAMKELVSCRMKCKDRISFADRQAIFTEYWQIGTYSMRSAYMSSLIEIVDKSTQRTRAVDPEKQKCRTKTYKYHFSIKGKREPVCKACLMKTLDESENFIKTVAKKNNFYRWNS